VLAAVSGGADSTALAHILRDLDRAGDLHLTGLVHFNHQLRASADRDEQFVAQLAASLGVDAKYHATQRLTLSIGPEVTWVNNQYAMTFFGLDAAQSTIAGIAPYRARSGINSVGVSAGASYMLTDHWSLAAHASYGRLQGDAANSPVTTDKTQRVYGGFVMYRF